MPYQPERHGPTRVVGPGFHARVFAVVRRVPRGRVTTYGDVGKAIGLATIARHVGYALAALSEAHGDVPWHRVVDGRGRIASRPGDSRQRALLAAEGVELSGDGRVVGFAALRVPLASLRG